VENEIQLSLSSMYKCSDVLARRVQEYALASMFGKFITFKLQSCIFALQPDFCLQNFKSLQVKSSNKRQQL